MALFNGEGFDELLADLKKNGDLIDDAAPEMLQAGAAVVADAWRDAIKTHDLIDTGDMLDSVGPTDAINTSTEKKIAVYPQGRDRKGIRNAEKAFILHYGRSNMKGDHFVDEADRLSEENAVPAMIEVWENSK